MLTPDWPGAPGAPGAALAPRPAPRSWQALVQAVRAVRAVRALTGPWRGRVERQDAACSPPAGPALERGLAAGPPAACEGEARACVFAMAGQMAGCADDAEAYARAVQLLETTLARLPERTRQIFLRRQVNGEGEAALAAEYGLPLAAVAREVAHALHGVQCATRAWPAGAA